jgi:hypothetical protein
MRRGLMGWSEADLPLACLKERISRLQARLAAKGLGGLVAYTNIARPAAVTFLTGFTPYWSEGLLFVPVSGEPVFATALSKRVSEWIRSVMPVGSIENTLQPAAFIGRRLAETGVGKVGVLELELFPAAQAEMLMGSNGAVALEDASGLFRAVRLIVDPAELVLVRRADDLARQCLENIDGSHDARRIVAAIESRARLAGAEESFIGVAPDLAHAGVFLRSDRLGVCGDHVAVRLSLSLKGSWVRRMLSLAAKAADRAAFAAAQSVFERALGAGSAVAALRQLRDGFPGKIVGWTLESCVGSYPLEVVASSGAGGAVSDNLPVSILSVQAKINDVGWFGAGPVLAPGGS